MKLETHDDDGGAQMSQQALEESHLRLTMILKEMELRLRQSEERFRLVVENAFDNIWTMGTDHRSSGYAGTRPTS